ncbi:FtsW/RodA/SpoVE family cell cycle protein [Brevibacillus fulvus]|uniref:Rod shape determining protein RodA n=1 Tax=Brevibacillus fulvus TaxID=1125967 RepID=A0A939BQQ1_9BACL|nr:FtsW/RodA/SpoVE family cell cycle protein [Brevibacillus fulvus]MBM7588767.1 rod shape determining protein RodA [Brevibacillus fulvus]
MEEKEQSDWLIYLSLTGLLLFGMITVFSATRATYGYYFVIRQCLWIVLGTLVAALVSKMDYRCMARYAHWFYLSGIVFLVSLFLLGKRVNGATSWLDLGFLRLQPSELTRLTTLFMLARVYEQKKGICQSWTELVQVGALLSIPTVLILLQPDLGMSLIYCSLLVCFFVLTQLPPKFHFALFAILILFFLLLGGLYLYTPELFFRLIRPHQWERLTSFLHPESDPLGSGFQYMQARKLVGSGQLGGMGMFYLLAAQGTKLPEQHTDFIFAVVAQEWGFIGASCLLLLYFLLLYRLIQWAMRTPDPFAAFFISGLVTMWSFQIFVNIGMNIGLSPITGLTLPFISYGGSSLLSNLIGFALAVCMRKPPPLWELEEKEAEELQRLSRQPIRNK